ncbi:acetone carboxylase subunit gamma [Rhodococcus ruber]|uniref:acetone carboxylase subunit gamma n=1 Tax=Rhodococcus TaxID=1827 RepID=UPI00029B09D3|nr:MULTISPECIES: acetone carboxylase subunit gamma [Rhodococcus]ATQ28976.1 acetone carboxylase subunit gamma [Rhodococcus ruber]
MQIPMTEYLVIDLETELWVCRVCRHELGSARGNYKEGTLVYDRDPREIHQPIIDPDRYEFTFSPDPDYCRILEYYCPGCGTQIETEYIPPGHPPTVDMEWDVDALRAQWLERGTDPGQVVTYGPGQDAEGEFEGRRHNHH